jgi:hypothetical protein
MATATACNACGIDDWTVLEVLGMRLCLGCVSLHKDQLTASALLGWAGEFLDLCAPRALSPTEKGALPG